MPRLHFNWSGFGGIPARYYGWLYLGLIPIFAILFMCLPQYSFYHSTTQYEQSLNDDAKRIIKDFENVFITRLRKTYSHGFIETKKWHINISDIHVTSFKTTGDSLTFTIRMEMKKETSQGLIVSRDGFSMTYPGNVSNFIADQNLRPKLYIKYPSFDPPIWKVVNDMIDYKLFFPPDGVSLFLPADLNNRIEGFRRAYRGFPSKISGNFIRMFYLSAITITTVGYGDIVPLSPFARISVAVEAILGVVLIGLFLNALVQTHRK